MSSNHSLIYYNYSRKYRKETVNEVWRRADVECTFRGNEQ